MTSCGIEPASFQFVAQHLNHCAAGIPLVNVAIPKYVTRPSSVNLHAVIFTIYFFQRVLKSRIGDYGRVLEAPIKTPAASSLVKLMSITVRGFLVLVCTKALTH